MDELGGGSWAWLVLSIESCSRGVHQIVFLSYSLIEQFIFGSEIFFTVMSVSLVPVPPTPRNNAYGSSSSVIQVTASFESLMHAVQQHAWRVCFSSPALLSDPLQLNLRQRFS